MITLFKSLHNVANAQQRWIEFGTLNGDEKILVRSITFTFGFYLIGALYLVAPVVGWGLLFYLMMRWVLVDPNYQRKGMWLVWLWCLSALLLEVALIIGHLDFDLGFVKMIKSTIGWAKGWALLSVFIVLGYSLNIRYQVICRAACVVGLIAILVTPLIIMAYLLGLPDHLYVSPLNVLGGSGDEYFTVILYEIDPSNGSPRWRFFAPWAPAVGFVANIYFLCAWFEKDWRWKLIGLIGNGLMIVLAASRMGMIVLLLVPAAVWGLSRMTRPWVMLSAALSLFLIALFIAPISDGLMTLLADIKGARADSTRVRAALGNIALYRWQSEAYWFGHGIVEGGTHLVKFMPIGSHHNWYGLLFVKGLVGFLSFAIPFALSTLVLLINAQYSVSARLALGMCLIIGFFSLSENIEALAYLTWPAWLLIGIGLRNNIADIDTYHGNLFSHFKIATHKNAHATTRAGDVPLLSNYFKDSIS